MLGEGEPVPEGLVAHEAAVRVFAEVADNVALSPGRLGPDPAQAVVETTAGPPAAAKRSGRAEPFELLVPGPFKQQFLKMYPTLCDDCLRHRSYLPECPVASGMLRKVVRNMTLILMVCHQEEYPMEGNRGKEMR